MGELNSARPKVRDRRRFLDFAAKSLTPRYLLALGTIALLSVIGQILIQTTLSGQSRDTVQRDLANDQRVLSHKLGRIAQSVQLTGARGEINQAQLALKEGLPRLKQVHEGLKRGEDALNLEGIESVSGRKALEAMEPHFAGMVKSAEVLIASLERRKTRGRVSFDVLLPARKLAAEEAQYRKGLETLLSAIEADSSAKIRHLKWIELSLLALTLGILLLEGLFIFRPAILRLKSAITELEGSEARKRAVLEASPDAIVTMDASGKVIELNPATERLFGLGADRILGLSLTELALKEEDRKEFGHFFGPFTASHGAATLNRKFEFPSISARGDALVLEGTVTPTFAGSRPVFTAFLSNLTQKKKDELELKEMVDNLSLYNEELQRFTYVASHDLQEPLRMISNYVTLLSRRYRDKLDKDAQDFVKFTLDGAARMQNLIVDLLNYSRVQTGPVALDAVDCNSLLDTVLGDLSLAIRESGAVVTRGFLPRLMGNASQIGQLFQNLVGNSLKYRGKEAPRIEVSAERVGKEWLFSVRDNGIGFDMEFAQRIFEPFQRLHGKSEYSGSGIGLAICKKVIDSLGGRIWATSEKNRGSTFFFTLPAAELNEPVLVHSKALPSSGIAPNPASV